MLVVNKFLKTDGKGYWSQVVRSVKVTGFDLDYVNEEGNFGELRVYFDAKYWDVNSMGLIYTDKQFLKELKTLLAEQHLGTDVEYSEQGMQGDTFVSLDCGIEFIKSFQKLITVTL